MIERKIRYGFLVLVTALLMSCGGSGGGSDDDSNGNVDPPDNGDDVVIGSVVVFSSSPQLRSDADGAGEGVEITALVRDENNNAVPEQPIQIAVNNDGTLIGPASETDENGLARKSLITPGNKRNRTLTVTASAGSAQDSIEIEVVGTELSLQGPNSLVIGDMGSFTATLVDAGGNGIPNETVLLSSALSNTFTASSQDTGSTGQVSFEMEANNAGDDTLTAEALGLTATKDVVIAADNFRITSPDSNKEIPVNSGETVTLNWEQSGSPIADGTSVVFSISRGMFTGSGDSTETTTTSGGQATVEVTSTTAGPATIEAIGATAGEDPSTRLNVEFIGTNPHLLLVQAVPQTLGPGEDSVIRAIVRDQDDNPVKNQRVTFNVSDQGGEISPLSADTDSRGVARTTYTAGDISSGQRQVEITASADALSESVTLTVARTPIDIELGTGNELIVPDDPEDKRFHLPYQALVTDTAGNPIADATIQLNVIPTGFGKGEFLETDVDGDGEPDRWQPFYASFCPNEDVDLNGFLEPGEDTNGNGQLDPGNVVTVPTSVTTNESGFASFNVTYFQDRNLWVEVRLEATTDVSGSEDFTSQTFLLPALTEDLDDIGTDPPGRLSPYGTTTGCDNAL